MNIIHDTTLLYMLGGSFVILLLGTLATVIINRRGGEGEEFTRFLGNLNARIKSWWLMFAIFSSAMLCGSKASTVLFAAVSFFALREFITLTATRRGDHRALGWVFFIILPLNYMLLAMHWYGLYSIFVPVFAFLWIPVRSAIAGDSQDFLARTAKIQWGLMVCVYFVSYAPALLDLTIPGYKNETARLLCFLVFVVQFSDVMQYVFGKAFGKRKIAPEISPNKTVEGFIGGVASAVLLGTCMYAVTPFTPWQAALMALVASLSGFGGGIVMSAIKRDRGVKDYGTLIPGHGGMIDRIDSLCFAAPVFFHLTRYFFAI